MFKEALKDVVDSTDGAVAGLIMGYDGIPLENYVAGDATVDVESVGMEYSVILKSVLNAAEMLEVGKAEEVSVKAERLTTVIRLITAEYFVAVTLQPGANVGKARYKLRLHGPRLAENLS